MNSYRLFTGRVTQPSNGKLSTACLKDTVEADISFPHYGYGTEKIERMVKNVTMIKDKAKQEKMVKGLVVVPYFGATLGKMR